MQSFEQVYHIGECLYKVSDKFCPVWQNKKIILIISFQDFLKFEIMALGFQKKTYSTRTGRKLDIPRPGLTNMGFVMAVVLNMKKFRASRKLLLKTESTASCLYAIAGVYFKMMFPFTAIMIFTTRASRKLSNQICRYTSIRYSNSATLGIIFGKPQKLTPLAFN